METDPVVILDRLLAKEPVDGTSRVDDEVTFDLAVSEDFFTGDRREAHSRVEAEFIRKFDHVLQLVVQTWGSPAFCESPLSSRSDVNEEMATLEAELYWRGALALAYWNRNSKVAFICIEHQDTELPYCLQLGVKGGA